MPDKPLTLEDMQDATGDVGEPDTTPIGTSGSQKFDDAAHPYGDDSYGKGCGSTLKQLGAGKCIKPGKGM